MRGGRGLSAALLLAVAAVGGAQAAAAQDAPAPAKPPALRVTYELFVAEDGVDTRFRVTARSTRPVDESLVDAGAATPRSPERQGALLELLSARDAVSTSGLERALAARATRVRFGADGSAGTVTIDGRGEAPWSVSYPDRRLELDIADLPAGVEVRARVRFASHAIRSVSPFPLFAKGDGRIEWRLGPRTTPTRLTIASDPPIYGERDLDFDEEGFIQLVLAQIMRALPFLLALLALMPLRRAGGSEWTEGKTAAELGYRLARSGLVVGGLLVVAWAVRDAAAQLSIQLIDDNEAASKTLDDVAWIVTSTVPFIAAFVLLRATLVATDRRVPVKVWVAALLSLPILVALGLIAADYTFRTDEKAVTTAAAIAGILPALLQTAFVIEALRTWVEKLGPDRIRDWCERKAWLSKTLKALRAILIVAVPGTWALDSYSRWRDYSGPDVSFADQIAPDEPFFFLVLMSVVLTGLLLTLLFGLGRALWLSGGTAPGRFLGRPGAVRITAVLMALFMLGIGGRIDRYPVSVQLLFAVLIIGLLLRERVRRVEVPEAVVDADREARVHRRLERDLVRRRLAKIYDHLSTPDGNVHGYVSGAAALREPQGSTAVLDLGPENTWRANARRAWRWGMLLASPAIAFAVGTLLIEEIPSLVDESYTFGIVASLLSIFFAFAFWTVATVLFGALYPYLPGPVGAVKALAFTLLYAVPAGLASLVTESVTDEGWPFVAAQLALVLGTLGVILDRATLRRAGLRHHQHLLDLYNVRGVKSAVAYASPALLLLATLVQQLATGEATSAVEQFLKALPGILNPGSN